MRITSRLVRTCQLGINRDGEASTHRRQPAFGQSVPNRRAIATIAILAVPIFYATIARASVPDVGLDSNARFTLPARTPMFSARPRS